MKTVKRMVSDEAIHLQKTARFAGWAYFLIITTSILSIAFGPYRLVEEGDMATTISNIADNQGLFRLGIVYELLMYTGVILLASTLYRLLQSIHSLKALFALLCRFGEALLGILMVVASIVTLYIINSDWETANIHRTVTLLFELKDTLMSILMVFIGIGSVVFFHLFYRARYIPWLLSVFGMFIFSAMVLESIVLLSSPGNAWVFPGAGAILLEIIVGLWLIIKGVKINQDNQPPNNNT